MDVYPDYPTITADRRDRRVYTDEPLTQTFPPPMAGWTYPDRPLESYSSEDNMTQYVPFKDRLRAYYRELFFRDNTHKE